MVEIFVFFISSAYVRKLKYENLMYKAHAHEHLGFIRKFSVRNFLLAGLYENLHQRKLPTIRYFNSYTFNDQLYRVRACLTSDLDFLRLDARHTS